MGKLVGIDLGTTNTVIAVVDGPRPRVLDSREGRPEISSVVSLKRRKGRKEAPGADGGEILVGDGAYDNWGFSPRDTVLSIKRLMGRAMADPEVQKIREWAQFKVTAPTRGTKDSVRVVLGDSEYAPEDISAMILRKAKEDAEFRLGSDVTHAVVTVPAYFSQVQREATRRAGLKAGLKVIKVLDEPTAAAIAFGQDSHDDAPRTLLVYDLGGGTFDVSLLMVAGNTFAPLTLEGDMWLGGDSLDQCLVDRVVRWVKEEYDLDPLANHRFMAELRKAARKVKERLSASQSADLMLTGMLQDPDGNLIDVDLEISRDELERSILPLIGAHRVCACGVANHPEEDRCGECGASLAGRPVVDGKALRIVKRALANENLTPDQVDHVLMAGNSSAVPLVQRSMEELFGAGKVLRKVHPKHSVAMGAAILAAWTGERLVCSAPDPADPKRECGHVNEPDATVCAHCGASLVLEQEPAPMEVPSNGAAIVVVRKKPGTVGGIAPFHYGTQTAGDRFNLFIRKGDPFPTDDPAAQTFYTRTPRQRMVSIPVYGGDHLDSASANELQGQAFALLPPDLPAETPVRITLALDGDGVFVMTAYLGDGRRLDPWIVKGDADAVAIEGLERVEALLAEKADALSPQEKAKLEKRRESVFDRMKAKDFDGAVQEVGALEKDVGEAGAPGGDMSLREKAEALMGFAQFVLGEYGWAFDDPNVVYRITRAVESAQEALARGNDAKLQEAVTVLDKATDDLPQAVQAFLALKGAILSQIQPVDRATAAELMAEVAEIEKGVKDGNMSVLLRLESVFKRVQEAIAEVETKRSGARRCASCGAEMGRGDRYCPKCRADSWLLGGKASTGTGPRI
jgi:molecular chaperone DnaK (HSP70)